MTRGWMLGVMLLTMSVPGWAHADHWDDHPFERPRAEVGLGLLAGGFSVGHVGGPAVGLHTDAGYRWGRLQLAGEYDFASVGEDAYVDQDAVRGHLHRVGVNARYTIGAIGGGRDIPLRGALWLEGGMGHQRIRWHEGGRLEREDLSFGVGAQLDIRHGDRDRAKVWSIFYAFRATVADAPEQKQMPPTCAGPCDEPTGLRPYDLGLFFNMGVLFGR